MENKISVCIASFNGANFIAQQLESILVQIKTDDEIIISDDSSTDATIKIINSFADPRIKVYPNQIFGNPIFNFENAIKKATGDVIFLADQDDVWISNKVDAMTNKLTEGFDLVVSNAVIGDEHLKTIRASYFAWRNSGTGLIKNFYRNSYLGCCMAFRKEILVKVLPFPKHIPMHDMWIGVVAEVFYKPVFMDEKLMIYRRHQQNATVLSEDFKSPETFLTKISFRTNLFYALLKRTIFNG
ncbi:glycosyltransferase involved in cell wall biosynthesis [Pedobacter sp. UYEF25]